jgi:hypothetical protein
LLLQVLGELQELRRTTQESLAEVKLKLANLEARRTSNESDFPPVLGLAGAKPSSPRATTAGDAVGGSVGGAAVAPTPAAETKTDLLNADGRKKSPGKQKGASPSAAAEEGAQAAEL